MLCAPVRYDPAWPEQFCSLKERLLAADPAACACWQIAHIGSTAVPGLIAKPIIDIQIAAARLEAVPLRSIEAAGFVAVPEITQDDPLPGFPAMAQGWAKRYARLDQNGCRKAQLHIRVAGQANHRFALMMRDFLRADPEAAALYGQMKMAAAQIGGARSDPSGAGAYLHLKDPFVALLARNAHHWAHAAGWAPPTE